VTNHSHINYYIDITFQKSRISEAKDSAHELVQNFINDTPVDTILCMDGTTVLGAFVAEELTKSGFRTMNAHQTIYVVEPEYNAHGQMIFRDNLQPMIRGKHVLILMASVTTGYTAKRAITAIGYYGGHAAGVASIYSAVEEVEGTVVRSVYSIDDLDGYESYDYRDCPYCKQGMKLDALVNSHGYSEL
jgi:orotate phosphoribosyltransferase